ncbi:MAG: asparagine synthase-related protein, partial [Polyangiaceae bacterium]
VRLDNRAELLDALSVLDASLAENALVLCAYQRWQEHCVQHLLGDFTFVIHDRRRQQLFAARDIAGARPLYYAAFGGVFAFASNPGALLALPELPRELDPRAVIDYLGDFPEDEAATLVRAVRRLAPGTQLVFGEAGARVSSYFDVQSIPERKLANDDEYAEALRAELTRAVACRVPKQGRCGVLLSGGLDSSMVTALAARVSSAPISTFSAVFDDTPECDERIYQRPVVRAAGTQHHEVRPHPSGPGADFETLCRTFGEPVPMGPHWLAWAATEAAAERGMNVLLTGADGDRVVSHGTGRTAELAYQHQWRELVREVRAVHDFSAWRKARVLAVHALLPFVPEAVRGALERRDPRRRRVLTNASRLLRADALIAAGVAPRLERVSRRALNTREFHERILTSSNRGRDVDLLDRLGSHFGLEFRHPFFDRRVIELCLSFPGEQKRNHGRPRFVLRNAMAGLVPDAVRFRSADTHFDAAFAAWNTPWALAQAADAAQHVDNLAPFVNLPVLRTVLEQLQNPSNSAVAGPVDLARRCVLLSKWLDSRGAPKIATQ